MARRILVVEDEAPIREMVCFVLEQNGFQPVEAEDYDSAVNQLNEPWPDLILLDWMLPGGSGIQFIKHLKRESMTRDIPVVMLTARGEEADRVRGLETGADDYITKPFSPSELVARVKAHLARYDRLVGSNQQTQGDTFQIRDIKIDKSARRVWIRGEETQFTTKEFELLAFLAEHPNHVFSKQELFKEIWDMDSVGDIATVTVHIKKIREKIELNTNKPQYIETIWGVGYRFKV